MPKIILKGLQGLNGLNRKPIPQDADLLTKLRISRQNGSTPESVTKMFSAPGVTNIGGKLMDINYGNSQYDENATESQLNDLNEKRGLDQPWYSQLTNSLGKMVGQAATAFADGTAGLLLGTGEMINSFANGESISDSVSKLFHNEVSDAVNEANKYMEEILPNYQTNEERDNPWYKNLDTMNFWADGLLKNMGFTIASIYTGNVWNAAFKSAGLLKNASTLGAKVAGSMISAVNEGRMEANNTSTDMLNLENQKLADNFNKRQYELNNAFNQRKQQILSSDMSANQKQANLLLLQEQHNKEINDLTNTYNNLKEDARQRANKAGIVDLMLNIPILAYNDFKTYGRIYANGFKAGRQQASKKGLGLLGRARENANEAILKEESPLMKRVIKNADGTYQWKKFTGKDAWLNLGKIGFREGNEEMAQQFASNMSGEWFSPDSPNAYYEAMRNNKSNLKTQDMLSSIVKGFNTSYGDISQWEQFAIGALNGIIGVPTFGKKANSTENTFIGRGKWLGISGGAIGEYRSNSAMNAKGQPMVDNMNKLINDVKDTKKLMAQSNSFINAMNGYSEANNKFEWQNHSDNDTFNLFTSYLQAGREDDLKQIINQQYDNLTDDQLNEVKDMCDFVKDEWLDKNGNLTDEGKGLMKQTLADRSKDMFNQFDKYKQALSVVNNTSDIPDEHKNEMAWLLWKAGRFHDRIQDILNKDDNKKNLNKVIDGITEYTDALREEQKALKGDETRKDSDKEINILEENQRLIEHYDTVNSILRGLYEGDTKAIGILANKKNKEFFESLLTEDFYKVFSDYSNLGYLNYTELMNNLKDTWKLQSAAKSFNGKLEEYTKNPSKIDEDHANVDKEADKQEEDKDKHTIIDNINNKSTSEVRKDLDNVDLNDLYSIFEAEESPQSTQAKQKVDEAKKINDTYNKALQSLNKKLQDGEINQEEYNLAKKKLNKSLDVSESNDELLDLDSESFNNLDDSEVTEDELNDFVKNKQQENGDDSVTSEGLNEAYNMLRQEKQDAAKNILSQVKDEINTASEMMKGMPNPTNETQTKQTTKPKEVSKDGVTASPTVAEQQKQNQKEERKKYNKLKKEQAEQKDISNIAKSILINEGIIGPTFESLQISLIRILDMMDSYIKDGLKNKTDNTKSMFYGISNTQSYKTVLKAIPTINDYLNQLYDVRKQEIANQLKEESKEVNEDKEYLRIGTDDNVVSIDEVTYTPDTSTTTNVDNQVTLNSNLAKVNKEDTLGFWYPTTTQYDRFTYRNPQEYYKNKNLTAEQKDRYKRIYEFLKEKTNNFTSIYNLQRGSKVKFVFSKSLNESVKDMVVLMTDENDNIIGDLPTPYDENFGLIKGLSAIYDKAFDIANQYKDATDDIIPIEGIETSVSKKMVGRPKFTAVNDRMKINDIFNGQQSLFGIAMNDGESQLVIEPGVSRYVPRSERELKTISPIAAKKGQPYVLIETSDENRRYYPVPITMPRLNDDSLNNTKIYKAITDVLSKLKGIQSSDEIVKVKDALRELLVLPILHINVTDGKLKVDIQRPTDSHIYTVYNGDVNSDNIVSIILTNLKGNGGTTFQVSRKYINSTYKGQSYNEMLGEIAETNLPQNATHTINDWFTVNPIIDGKETKAKNPKSLNMNTHQEDKNTFSMTNPTSGRTYTINRTSSMVYEVTPNGLKVLGNTRAEQSIKAYLWANSMGYTKGVVKTPFCVYDLNKAMIVTDTVTKQTEDLLFELGQYFEGGGANIKDAYPNLTEDMINELGNYFMGYGSFTEARAKEILNAANIKDTPVEKKEDTLSFSISYKNRKSSYKVTPIYSTDTSGNTVITFKSDLTYEKGAPKGHKEGEHRQLDEGNGFIQINKDDIDYAEYAAGIRRPVVIGLDELDRPIYEYRLIHKEELIQEEIDMSKKTISFLLTNQLTNKEEVPKVTRIIISKDGRIFADIIQSELKVPLKKLPAGIEASQSTPTGETRIFTTKEQTKELKPQDVIDNIKKVTKKRATSKIQIILNNMSDNQEVLNLIYNAKKLQLNLQLPKVEATVNLSMSNEQQAEIIKKLFNGKVLNREELKGKEFKPWNQKIEEAKTFKMLPQLGREGSTRLVSSIKNMNGNSKIYGQFRNGVLYIANDAARGTLYHEAFHYVTQCLLTNKELNSLYEQAKSKYGDLTNLDLEEKMAEDFRNYMQDEEGFKGFFVKIWRNIKNIINTIFHNQNAVDKMFYDISKGNYANREASLNDVILNSDEFSKVRDKAQYILDNAINNRYWKDNVNRHDAIGKILDEFERSGYHIKSITRRDKDTSNLVTRVKSIERTHPNSGIKSNDRLKHSYVNLTQEQREYLNSRGITKAIYDKMSQEEKETLFRCM